MLAPCPNCNELIVQSVVPVRGSTPSGNEAWICNVCPDTICIVCYHSHTAEKHPKYGQKPTKGHTKNKKRKK